MTSVKPILVFLILAHISFLRGEDDQPVESEPRQTVNWVVSNMPMHGKLLRLTLLPLDDLASATAANRVVRFLLLGDWHRATIVTMFEIKDENSNGLQLGIWVDHVSSNEMSFTRKVIVATDSDAMSFFDEIFSEQSWGSNLFDEDYWKNSKSGAANASRYVVEKLEGSDYTISRFIPPRIGDEGAILESIILSLVEVTGGAMIK